MERGSRKMRLRRAFWCGRRGVLSLAGRRAVAHSRATARPDARLRDRHVERGDDGSSAHRRGVRADRGGRCRGGGGPAADDSAAPCAAASCSFGRRPTRAVRGWHRASVSDDSLRGRARLCAGGT
eukprot:Amastigsp_a180124_8.p3 type:complete len:125 gc:universal Amastigsp_a180124_8:612-238(-)